MKMIREFLIASFACVVIALAAGWVSAQERPLQFIHVLQKNGYGDMAVEYLGILKNRPDLQPEVRDVWDLEMSKSLKAAANIAFDDKEYERLMEESQKHLAKFIKEKPNHSKAAVATASWGDFLAKKALQSIRLARSVEKKNPQQYQTYLDDARATLGEAREKFRLANEKFKERLAQFPPPSKLPTRKVSQGKMRAAREELEANLEETRFQLSLVEYYLAQTFADPKNPERIAALKKAGKAFDAIFQRNRGSVTGVYAHMWHGKTAEEAGDLQLALDIYDEVLANAPDPGDRGRSTGLEPLFAQVEHFRLLILAKQKPKEFLAEARAWLKYYKRLKQTDGYQGIALELAKATLKLAEKATGAEKAKRNSEALKILAAMAKIHSQYQQEAILLRLDLLKGAGDTKIEAKTFDEAVTLGDVATADQQWEQARTLYLKALDLATDKDAERAEAVREALAGVQFMMARSLFNKGKLDECVALVGKIIRDDDGNVKKESKAAAQASALAVTASLNLYVNAPASEKPVALEKLVKVAEFTENNWPDAPEADDARMARGQAKLVTGQIPEAIEIFKRVNPKSERYPLASYMAGLNYWRLCVSEKKKPENVRDDDRIVTTRTKAIECLESGLQTLKTQVEPDKPPPKYFVETQLLLAEIRYDSGKVKEAAALYQPLVDRIEAEKSPSFDATTIRVFLGAVRAYATLDELDKAGEISDVLISLGPDTSRVNAVLVEFAKLLDMERKKVVASVTELETTTKDAELNAAKARLESVQELLGKILVKLAERQEVSLAGMVFIGDTLGTIGKTAEASEEYQKIIKRTETDPEFAKRAKRAMTRIRAQLIGVLRKEGKFEAAMKEVDQLIKDNPRALEPLMEKGRILEGWAEEDPAHFKEAVGHWVMLRSKLQRIRGKKPPEYYDVMYNVAACLVREAEKSKDKTTTKARAMDAERVLKSALVLSPKLNGPDTVARYKVLRDKAISLQGRSP